MIISPVLRNNVVRLRNVVKLEIVASTMNVVFVQNVSVNLIAAKRKHVVLKEIAVH